MKNTDNDKNNVKIAIRWRPAVKSRQVAIEKVDEKVSVKLNTANIASYNFLW